MRNWDMSRLSQLFTTAEVLISKSKYEWEKAVKANDSALDFFLVSRVERFFLARTFVGHFTTSI